MALIRNIFACLVHESQECAIDLIRNLHCLDPDSVILLYNGGRDPNLLSTGFPFGTYGAIAHPSPKPMEWGRLHNFALDCMQFALSELPFDTLTIVDSDQLATRRGYSQYLAEYVNGRDRLGLLGSSPGVQHHTTSLAPAQTAFREIELWRPYLRRFPQGEQKFVHWSFWPSTVFTDEAASNLIRLFATDSELRSIMSRSGMWATEELILPTLVALLGYEIDANPCSYDFVKYRADYTAAQVDEALAREDVFWVHPIPRRYDDPLRERIRQSLGYDRDPVSVGVDATPLNTQQKTGIPLSIPILNRIKNIQGWLDEEEADLLLAICNRALSSLPASSSVVEIGSFCGRSTVVLGSVVQSLKASTKVYAIDSHEGMVGAAGSRAGVTLLGSTLDIFRKNIAVNDLMSIVEPIVKRSYEVNWEKPIALLFIDGLHDYENVSRDFRLFEPWVVAGGYIAFHDYAEYYPGVKVFVDALLALPEFELVHCAKSMIVVRKIVCAPTDLADRDASEKTDATAEITSPSGFPLIAKSRVASAPLASCIMPTANRRTFVPQAIRHFLRQDYDNRELIIIDDGTDNISDLVPPNERIRYIRLNQKLSMGAKHNMACEMAHGEIIVHWDDDDWISHRRISYQVCELQEQTTRTSMETICGLSRVIFYEPRVQRAWEYNYPGGRPWVLGSTFCYYKRFSERHRFPDMNEGADTTFVWNLHNANVRAHPEHTFYIGTVHANNTSPKRTETIGWRSLSNGEVRSLMDDEDWWFYEHFSS